MFCQYQFRTHIPRFPPAVQGTRTDAHIGIYLRDNKRESIGMFSSAWASSFSMKDNKTQHQALRPTSQHFVWLPAVISFKWQFGSFRRTQESPYYEDIKHIQ